MSNKSPGDLQIEDDERHSDDVADYVQRNREALNASIKKSRSEAEKGRISNKTMDAGAFSTAGVTCLARELGRRAIRPRANEVEHPHRQDSADGLRDPCYKAL
jgi:hypothetical protein